MKNAYGRVRLGLDKPSKTKTLRNYSKMLEEKLQKANKAVKYLFALSVMSVAFNIILWLLIVGMRDEMLLHIHK